MATFHIEYACERVVDDGCDRCVVAPRSLSMEVKIRSCDPDHEPPVGRDSIADATGDNQHETNQMNARSGATTWTDRRVFVFAGVVNMWGEAGVTAACAEKRLCCCGRGRAPSCCSPHHRARQPPCPPSLCMTSTEAWADSETAFERYTHRRGPPRLEDAVRVST